MATAGTRLRFAEEGVCENKQSFAESNTASTVDTAGEVSSCFASAFADSIIGKFGLRATNLSIPIWSLSLITSFPAAE
jgi:hypothetical protein